MNKVAGIGIVVVVIIGIIVVAMNFNDDSGTTITQVGGWTVESSNEVSVEETAEGNDYSIILHEKIQGKVP